MSEPGFRYSHGAVLVSNLERSAEFYRRAVGWEFEFGGEYDESLGEANGYKGKGRMMMGKLGGVRFELVEMEVKLEPKTLSKHYGMIMCSVIVSNLEPVRERLKTAGIAITRQVDVGRTRMIVVTDPDGQEIGILGARPASDA